MLGIRIFITEFFKVFVKRLLFIAYVMLTSLVVFPLVAGSVATLLLFTIPVIYMVFALPALMFGLCLALFMMTFRSHAPQGGSVQLFFAMLVAPLSVLFCFYVLKPLGAIGIFMFFKHQVVEQFQVHGWMVLVAVLFFGSFIVAAGGVVSVLLKKDMVRGLLAAPTSVRRQLMTLKNTR